MNGGVISGANGVGVSNRSGSTFTMNGGTISDNSGGGVSNGGTFRMNGGVIHSNRTSGSGGGVSTSGIFTMRGGTIHSNTADASGGGVNQTGGTFNFNGGWISYFRVLRQLYYINSKTCVVLLYCISDRNPIAHRLILKIFFPRRCICFHDKKRSCYN